MTGNRNPESPAPAYTMGYSDEFQKLLGRRNAAVDAGHLLPLLGPGLRVLDFGCGPGTISMGLASAVTPGELHGIDMETSQVEMARAAAAAGGHDNAFFQTGDATDLPFEDDSFDVAHCHAVLMHVPDTQAVLAEVKRVLKPGGIISAREMIGHSTFFEPEVEDLSGAMETFLKLLRANGGHPRMGSELKRVLLEAGFSGIRTGASFEPYTTTEDVHFFHAFANGWFFAPGTVDVIVKHGLASREKIDGWRRMLDEWRDAPGAMAAIAWGEAIARKL